MRGHSQNSTSVYNQGLVASASSKQADDMYKNVLSYPEGIEHFKFFDGFPHGDKITDRLLAILEAMPKPDLNVNPAQKEWDFAWMKKRLWPKLSLKDKKLLNIVNDLKYLAKNARSEDDRIAYTHVRNCFLNYYSTLLDENIKPDIQWIDYDFALRDPSAKEVEKDLVNNLLNKAAWDKLVEKLHEAGAFAKEKKDFYLWNTDPHNWSEISYQSRSTSYRGMQIFKSLFTFNLPP